MKNILPTLVFLFAAAAAALAQNPAQKIYDTEKAFEKAVAERGLNAGFIEFSAADGKCFFPGYPVNCIEFFAAQKPSPAALFWNPTYIDVSSNGALAYSTGNSVYKANGPNDAKSFYGEYATVWQRQPDGSYKAAIDLGIAHAEPNAETKWTSPADLGKEPNEKRLSAADASTAFFETAARAGLAKAYRAHLAADARLLRDGMLPVVGRANALALYKKDRGQFLAAKRSVFVGAADLAYVSNTYQMTPPGGGAATENGTFLQVWKLRGGRWQIVLDVFAPAPPARQ